MTAPLGKLATDTFLTDYWQKEPCLIRQAIPGFTPPLDANDLAGLALDDMAESRLVSGCMQASDWRLAHGPFSEEDFQALPAENWTLLVQDVEKHYLPLQELMAQFNFLPGWRIDDLMISYAVKGGSVGPHTDQYDVFLFQAEGRRRWQISQSFDPTLLENCPLNVLQQFEPEQEWVLDPGDLLYLPPNVAHHGVALEPGMTWSIGARAPSGADLLQGLGEWLAFFDHEGGRYRDPELSVDGRPGEINRASLDAIRAFMLKTLDESSLVDEFVAQFLSRFRQAHEPVSPPQITDPVQLLEDAKNGGQLIKNPWSRITWIEQNEQALLFASGTRFVCSISLAMALSGAESPQLDLQKLDRTSLQVLVEMINQGHFILA